MPDASPGRPVVFDLTHLVSRLPKRPTSGIDRIDLAYATRFAGAGAGEPAVHYGLRRPHLIAPREAAALVRLSRALWDSEDAPAAGDDFAAVLAWLASRPAGNARPSRRLRFAAPSGQALRRLHQARGRVLHDFKLSIPEGAIYLNVAQHLFEHGFFFRWLETRRDLRRVFMIHDLLPLDYPEYFPAANLQIFRRRIATAFRHADAFLVSTKAVKARLETALTAASLEPRPIHVEPFPSPLASRRHRAGAGDGHPYFVMLGTIEPRKNHIMMLHVWRRLVERDPQAPRLVLVGARGWENEQVADILDRSVALRAHVLELAGLPSADLATLLGGALALLAPSFDEGYGLPLVEALTLGVPVIASDIPVFREVTRECATFVAPLDGPRWVSAIERMVSDGSFRTTKTIEASEFAAPTWAGYFAGVEAFLASL